MKLLLLFFTLTVAEELVKIEETFGEFSDIILNSRGRWYIIYNTQLCTSIDKGVTREDIDLPSKQSVRTGLGIDESDNIYVQDWNLILFRVIRSESGDFLFEEISLPHVNERLVSRPFSLENNIYFASKSGLMKLKNKYEKSAEELYVAPYGNLKITHALRLNYTTSFNYKIEAIIYSGGANRQWIYRLYYSHEKPIWQTESSVKRMNVVNNNIYYVVNDINQINVIEDSDELMIPIKIEGIEASNINFENDFIIYSPYYNKTYVYMNVNDKGTIYRLGDNNLDGNIVVDLVSNLDDKVTFNCAVFYNDTIYFGTSNGVYKLMDSKQNERKTESLINRLG